MASTPWPSWSVPVGELVPFAPQEEDALDLAEPTYVPPELVQAIAIAAVEAYKQGVAEQRRVYQRAYRAVNRDRINARERRRRALR